MLRITYKSFDHNVAKETNNIQDLIDIATSLVDDPLIDIKIGSIATWMNWGDEFKTKDYTIECYKE